MSEDGAVTDDTHEVPRGTSSLHPTVEWLTAHGQRVAGPFGAMAATPAVFWTPADSPTAPVRMAVPGDVLVSNGATVAVMLTCRTCGGEVLWAPAAGGDPNRPSVWYHATEPEDHHGVIR